MRMEGVYVAHATPFDEKYQLDLESLQNLFKYLNENRVSGLVCCATTGESPTLSDLEWEKILSEALKYRSEMKIIASCGTASTEKTIEKILKAKEMEAHAALVVTPYYNKPTEAGLIKHYETLVEKTSFPILIYHIPARTGVSLSSEALQYLLKNPYIVGIKESSGNLYFWNKLIQKLDLNKCSLLAGDDYALSTLYMLGGSGIISASANVIPQFFVQIYNHLKKGEYEKAFLVERKVFALVESLFLETNPAGVKWALSQLKIIKPHLRLPLVTVSQNTKDAIEKNLKLLELI